MALQIASDIIPQSTSPSSAMVTFADLHLRVSSPHLWGLRTQYALPYRPAWCILMPASSDKAVPTSDLISLRPCLEPREGTAEHQPGPGVAPGSIALGSMMDAPASSEPEATVGQLLRERGLTLSLAESCTGGLVSHRITNVPGSSEYFRGGVVAYSNDVKESTLGVSRGTLCRCGAVSEQTAREMAEGVRGLLGAEVGLAITGVAGPGGGTAEKPVGLVFVAVAMPGGVQAERFLREGDRAQNKASSADAALGLLRQWLEGVAV